MFYTKILVLSLTVVWTSTFLSKERGITIAQIKKRYLSHAKWIKADRPHKNHDKSGLSFSKLIARVEPFTSIDGKVFKRDNII